MKITLLTGKTSKIKEAFDFELKIKSSATARRLTLRVDSKERIPVLSLPKFCSAKKAIEFVRTNQDWIMRQLAYVPELKKLQDQDTISIMGQSLTIQHNPNLRAGVYIEQDILHVSGSAEFLHRRVTDFIKQTAKKELTRLTREMAAQIGQSVNNVVIKDTKTRWGSCSSNHNINYSWRIALAPIEVIRYLVAHETAHLKHLDHSREFWACVRSLEPRSAYGKNWLKLHGKELYGY